MEIVYNRENNSIEDLVIVLKKVSNCKILSDSATIGGNNYLFSEIAFIEYDKKINEYVINAC